MKQNKTFINDSTKMKQLLKIYHNDSTKIKQNKTFINDSTKSKQLLKIYHNDSTKI